MNWKDHPVVISAISGVAGVAFAVQFLFPSLNAQINHDHKVEIDALSSQKNATRAELSNQQAKNKQLTLDAEVSKNEVHSLQAIIAVQKETIAELEMGRVFDLANPYPVGFRQIQVLDDINKVASHYEEDKINKERSGFWKVKVEHALFKEVIYYFDRFSEGSEKQTIYQISYRIRDFNYENRQRRLNNLLGGGPETAFKAELSDDFLITTLNETLGNGISWEDGPDTDYAWTTPYSLTAYITSPLYDSFTIAFEGLAPGSWRHPIPRYQSEAMCRVD